MGDVYLGVAQGPAGFSKLMVIKMLRPALAEDEQFLAMFLEEARLAARLNHPNVVQTTEVGNEGRRHFLAMEYLEGQSLQRLRQRVAKERAFPLGPHLRILVETLNGLHYAHELVDIDGQALGIVHRDATPHNIFVTYDGQVKVVDFGIAKAMDSSLETRTGELKGKVAYMPPEQASAQRVDRRADVFAAGVMVWEAAVGRRMWKGLNEVAIMHELLMGNIPSPRSVDPRVPPELDAICRRALAPRAEDRYATAADFAAELERFLVTIGDRTTTRDVARLVSEAFEADRREMREIIDAQLRSLRSSEPNQVAPMPKLGAPSGGVTPSVSLARPSAAQLDAGAAPSFTAGGTASSTTQPSSRKTPLLVAGGMIAAALGILGIVVMVVLKKPATSGPQPLATTTADAPNAITLDVKATPGADLFLDDAPLGKAPYHGAYPRDGLAHRLKVDEVGYIAHTEIVVFDKPAAQLDIALKPMTPLVPSNLLGNTSPPPPTARTGGSYHPAPAATTDNNPFTTPMGAASSKKSHPRTIDTSFGN